MQKSKEEELKDKIDDSNLQFIVLLQLIIERIDFLEENNYLFGSIKSFLKNGKTKFENFMRDVFKREESINGDTAKDAASKILVMTERVELALLNQYILTVDERKARAREVLSAYMIAPMVDKAIEEMESKNLFNF